MMLVYFILFLLLVLGSLRSLTGAITPGVFFLLSSVSWAADFTDGLVVAQSFSVVLVYTDVAPVDGS